MKDATMNKDGGNERKVTSIPSGHPSIQPCPSLRNQDSAPSFGVGKIGGEVDKSPKPMKKGGLPEVQGGDLRNNT